MNTTPLRSGGYRCAALLIACSAAVADLHAADITVDAKANIFGAGHATPPAPAGFGAGILPPSIPITSTPALAITFGSITGSVTYSDGTNSPASPFFGPEGSATFDTSLSAIGGLSSINGTGLFWLVGVFLDDSEPSDPAPAGLPPFTETAKQFTSLSPGLRQIFFIGDGQQAGSPQLFNVPAGATRLFLGFADGDGGAGQAGYYNDNQGALNVVVNVPEPYSMTLVLSGAFFLGGRRHTGGRRISAGHW